MSTPSPSSAGVPGTPGPAEGAGAPTLADVVRVIESLYPPSTAESWDAVGLVAGDPAEPVRKVLLAVDPVDTVLDEAVEWGADLVVSHHPLLLRPVHSVAATTFKGALVHRAVRTGVALYVAHTNADVAAGGVADALARALGVVETVPLVPLDTAGSDGTGTGRVGRLDPPVTLGDLADRVAATLPATAQGVRVAGALDARVERVAVVGGSGDGFFDDVRAAGVDVYVTADLRHHPASELRERAEHEARAAGLGPEAARPFLVDVAHFASEWPWLDHAARDIAAALGTGTVELRVSTRSTDPWTARVASPA
ncbi:Nif3-like dinuclear metal center hexameric protein [Luteimicrobium subarcticum]|uniref:GTP cyclohydrolase 1 type 2 homolog n=1 Tax=Luteimicrobium subarcticum TaxID=620910 RepID=A0A2M8WRA3_9MICO|nr:Nif3-like dinuclear metal center hexameric protein [Luteimicrobium subarcticum]PJI93434.1 dinuclear metal center YbgI/SA1388 family protein [Luteimicrobium subarcticum]